MELPADPVDAAARVLMTQVRLRAETKYERSPNAYMESLIEDFTDRAPIHEARIVERLRTLAGRLDGMTYRSVDLVAHATEAAADPECPKPPSTRPRRSPRPPLRWNGT